VILAKAKHLIPALSLVVSGSLSIETAGALLISLHKNVQHALHVYFKGPRPRPHIDSPGDGIQRLWRRRLHKLLSRVLHVVNEAIWNLAILDQVKLSRENVSHPLMQRHKEVSLYKPPEGEFVSRGNPGTSGKSLLANPVNGEYGPH